MKKILTLALLATWLFTGCQSYKKVPYLQGSEALKEAKAAPLYDARIMPKDLLTIVVSCPEEPELAEPFNLTVATQFSVSNRNTIQQPTMQQYLVDNEGNVDFPVLGTIHLGGLTKGEAEQLIKNKLKPQFKEMPIVTVRMVNYKISVIGEVNRPGTFTISNEKVNLFEALAMAGDLSIYGMRDNVKLIREDRNGERQILTLNLNDKDILFSPYYYLQQNDILYITPNKTKAKNSDISSSTTIWFTFVGSLLSIANIIITLTK